MASEIAIAPRGATGPLQENPILLAPNRAAFENPLFLPQGPASYNVVFGKVLDTVSDYFEIAEVNRQEGRIESFPRVAPGLTEPWKPGSPDLYQRTLASFQSIRHRAVVKLSAADIDSQSTAAGCPACSG